MSKSGDFSNKSFVDIDSGAEVFKMDYDIVKLRGSYHPHFLISHSDAISKHLQNAMCNHFFLRFNVNYVSTAGSPAVRYTIPSPPIKNIV